MRYQDEAPPPALTQVVSMIFSSLLKMDRPSWLLPFCWGMWTMAVLFPYLSCCCYSRRSAYVPAFWSFDGERDVRQGVVESLDCAAFTSSGSEDDDDLGLTID
jgi:hypothetical protein